LHNKKGHQPVAFAPLMALGISSGWLRGAGYDDQDNNAYGNRKNIAGLKGAGCTGGQHRGPKFECSLEVS
jgi:hypothetical protein